MLAQPTGQSLFIKLINTSLLNLQINFGSYSIVGTGHGKLTQPKSSSLIDLSASISTTSSFGEDQGNNQIRLLYQFT